MEITKTGDRSGKKKGWTRLKKCPKNVSSGKVDNFESIK